MRGLVFRVRLALVAVLMATSLAGAFTITGFSANDASAAEGDITTYPLTNTGMNGSPALFVAGPDGNTWFATTDAVGKITPTGTRTQYPLPADVRNLISLIAGPDGNLWFVTSFPPKVGKLTTAGDLTMIPGTFISALLGQQGGLIIGPDNNVWLWNLMGATRITTAGVVTSFPVGGDTGTGGGLSAFVAGPDGNFWLVKDGVLNKMTPDGTLTPYSDAGRVSGLAAGADGNVWFTATKTGVFPQVFVIGKITPAGVITEYTLPTANGVFSLALGPDDNLWFSGAFTQYTPTYSMTPLVGRVTAAGVITEFPSSGSLATGSKMVEGPGDNLWFVKNGVNSQANVLTRLQTDGTLTDFPFNNPIGQPALGGDGKLWLTEIVGRAGDQIHQIGASGTSLGVYPVPNAQPGATGLLAGPDGKLWFYEEFAGKIGRITTEGEISETDIGLPPPGGSSNAAMAFGSDGNLWFIQASWVGGPRIGRITPAGVFTQFPVGDAFAGAGGALVLGADNNLWFAARSSSFTPLIGRLKMDGTVTMFPAASPPSAIFRGPDGNIWYIGTVMSGSYPNVIGKITMDGTITEFSPPTLNSISSLVAGVDGNIWFSGAVLQYTPSYSVTPKMGYITPQGDITEIAFNPLPEGRLYNMVQTDDGNFWFAGVVNYPPGGENNTLRYVAKVTPGGAVTTYDVPTLGNSGASMTVGPDGSIWAGRMNTMYRVTSSGVVTEFPINYGSFVFGPDDNLWFTTGGDASRSTAIAKLDLGGSAPSPSPSPSPSPVASVAPLATELGTVTFAQNGNEVTVEYTPPAGGTGDQMFIGWQVGPSGDLVVAQAATPLTSWANPYTFSIQSSVTITPVFGKPLAFSDVPTSDPAYEALRQLSARGYILGYSAAGCAEKGLAAPCLGLADDTLRAQMAALIVRSMNWEGEPCASNPFTDRGSLQGDLWQAVCILANKGVAKGYDGTRFGPNDDVSAVQTISLITRAMVELGYWSAVTPQEDNPSLYPTITAASGHRWDVLTYHRYVGGVPQQSATGSWNSAWSPATRSWFAIALWQALETYYGK